MEEEEETTEPTPELEKESQKETSTPEKNEQDDVDGQSTPPSKIPVDDEYLAWTLGGSLKKTVSPGSPWAPELKGTQELESWEDDDVDLRLKMLE